MGFMAQDIRMVDRKVKILIVDADNVVRGNIRNILIMEGHRVFEAKSPSAAKELISKEFFDLVILENNVTKMDGIEALKEMREISPGLQVIITEETGTLDNAVEAFRAGAYDYMVKPVYADSLIFEVQQIAEHWMSKSFNLLHQKTPNDVFDTSLVVGRSKKMKDVLEMVGIVAPAEASVLIAGEPGTEKELIADALHKGSNRAKNRFVKINCSAFSEESLESELFGHEKGALAGSSSGKSGKLELADMGTIFLDEIGKMALSTQTKLLRTIQEGEFEPIGSRRRIGVNLRIVTANNGMLKEEVKKGTFRSDLLFCLNVVQIEIPPLRERREDIIPLTEYFLNYYNHKNGRRLQGFCPEALNTLVRYSWPGNIMELKNVAERSVILTAGDYVQFHQLPESIRDGESAPSPGPIGQGIRPGMTIREMEKELILVTLERNNGNRTKTAVDLGVTRRTLQNKLKEYGIDHNGSD
jgi:two-component system response regulator HydG